MCRLPPKIIRRPPEDIRAMKSHFKYSSFVSLLLASVVLAQIPEAPPIPPPDDRYEADILLVARPASTPGLASSA